MPEIAGKDIVLKVNTGTDTSPSWTAVGAQRGFTLEDTNEPFDNTSKDSTAREYEYGWDDGTISLDGVYIPDDAGLQELKTAKKNKAKIKVEIHENGVAAEEAMALITSRSIEGPHDDMGTYSFELQVSGGFTDLP
jgi:TP901-1 family phage major tail protein